MISTFMEGKLWSARETVHPPPRELPTRTTNAIFAGMNIICCDYRPSRARRKKPTQPFPLGRIVTARKPKPRHYGEIRYGVPDDAERTRLAAAFIERKASE